MINGDFGIPPKASDDYNETRLLSENLFQIAAMCNPITSGTRSSAWKLMFEDTLNGNAPYTPSSHFVFSIQDLNWGKFNNGVYERDVFWLFNSYPSTGASPFQSWHITYNPYLIFQYNGNSMLWSGVDFLRKAQNAGPNYDTGQVYYAKFVSKKQD